MSTLYYVHDPMCSWCWAFRPAWQQIAGRLPDDIQVIRLLGGLAADTDEPMPESMRRYLRQTWGRIQSQVPGTRFNFDFWDNCSPRRATYPACRAVIAAREQGAGHEEAMILAIQQAYYLQSRNPSDEQTLIELATETGLDPSAFTHALRATGTQAQLDSEMVLARGMGVESFPSLVIEQDGMYRRIVHDYLNPDGVLRQVAGG